MKVIIDGKKYISEDELTKDNKSKALADLEDLLWSVLQEKVQEEVYAMIIEHVKENHDDISTKL